MKLKLYICILLTVLLAKLNAQELNAKFTIRSDKIQGVEKDVFTSLENSMTQLLNEYKWTNDVYKPGEKIECTFTLILNSMPDATSYEAELQINSRRPVYNSSYSTPLFAYNDTEVSFTYAQGESLEFNETNITNNLVAIVAFYANVVIGLDYDSFAPNGGRPYFDRAMSIVNAAQSLSTKGWTAFDNDKNRYALGLALTEESSSAFHTMWYNYHRLGLDEMSTSALRGRDRIIAALPDLQKVYSARPASPLLLFFGDTKLDEVADIYSEASSEEKKEAYELLRRIYPTKTRQLDAIKKTN